MKHAASTTCSPSTLIDHILTNSNSSLSNFSQRWGKNLFDKKRSNNSFKNYYANLALQLVNKLPHAPNKFNLDSVLAYYKKFLNTEIQKFTFLPTSEDSIIKLPKDTNPEKAAGIDNLFRSFLKNGGVALALPISKLYNLLMKRSNFP